ncbi:acetyl esterase [Escherichia coli]|uniref:Acetyl esterase n=1 Tax=Escherichia coli TaxID=562 RepID=A0A377DGP9_ECOLX|nr:acetyl esterase [Escherichia coli]
MVWAYGLRDSVTRRLLGGVWDGLTQQDLQMYEEAYLSNDADRESPYYCLFNNDLTREVPPCFIAGRSSIRCWMTAVCFTRR